MKEECDFTPKEMAYVEFHTDPDNEKTFRSQIHSYKAAGYSTNTAEKDQRVEAHRIHNREHIYHAIKKRLNAHYERQEMGAKEAIARQSELGRFDIGDCLKIHENTCKECGAVEHQAFIDIKEAQLKGLTRHIKSISYDKFGRQIVTFHDSMTAQDRILKTQGAYNHQKDMGANTLSAGFDLAMKALDIANGKDTKEIDNSIDGDYEVMD